MNAVWPTALNCVPILLVALFVFVWFFLKMATAAEADRNSSVRRLPLRRPSFLSLYCFFNPLLCFHRDPEWGGRRTSTMILYIRIYYR